MNNILKKVFTFIIPAANPDYEEKIGVVGSWLVEINEKTYLPEREIGLDENNHILMCLPDGDNYGYWTDNNLKLSDFGNHFEVSEITPQMFEKMWRTFKEQQSPS